MGHAPTGANALHAATAGGWLVPIRALLQHVGAAEQEAVEAEGGGYDEDEEEEEEEEEDNYIDSTDKEGHTALWHAAANGHAPAIRFLLRWGADPLLPDAAGELPRQAAAAAGFADCVALLEVGVHVVWRGTGVGVRVGETSIYQSVGTSTMTDSHTEYRPLETTGGREALPAAAGTHLRGRRAPRGGEGGHHSHHRRRRQRGPGLDRQRRHRRTRVGSTATCPRPALAAGGRYRHHRHRRRGRRGGGAGGGDV